MKMKQLSVPELVFRRDGRLIKKITRIPEVRPVKQTVQKIIWMKTVIPLLNPSVLLLTPENELERWRTNLFVRTTKRNYSMELNARTFRQPEKIAFVVNYQYPQERRKEQAEIEKKRTEALARRRGAGNQPFLENAKSPRNWQVLEAGC